MLKELIVAGFGGQGVLSLGMTLTYAGMLEGKEISWMPSYGPEMRGGTANCMTIISDHPISSPIISSFDSAILLNQPSMDKFEPKVKPGGLLLYDSGNMLHAGSRTDIEIIGIPASTAAWNMHNSKVMNMIMLGAYLRHTPVVKTESVMEALMKVLPEKYHHLVPINQEAIELGAELIQSQMKATVLIA